MWDGGGWVRKGGQECVVHGRSREKSGVIIMRVSQKYQDSRCCKKGNLTSMNLVCVCVWGGEGGLRVCGAW